MSSTDYLVKIREVVHAIARREDSELRRYSGKGVMGMPELAFVHQVAKELSIRSDEIFGSPNVKWYMNRSFGAGLTDLIIEPQTQSKKIAMEFKFSGDVRRWLSDIDKIRMLDGNEYDRIFIALVDVFVDDLSSHGRIIDIDNYPGTARIGGSFDFFTTNHIYATQTCCVVGVWFINDLN